MHYKKSFILLFLFGVMASCSTSSSGDDETFLNNPPPPDWKEIDARGKFTFSLPSVLGEKKVHGIDSYVGVYESPALRISFDYGWYSGVPADGGKEGYTREEIQIDGQKAVITSYPLDSKNAENDYAYFTAVHFPGLPETEDGLRNKLTMSAYCKTKKDRSTAHTIFGSIRFP